MALLRGPAVVLTRYAAGGLTTPARLGASISRAGIGYSRARIAGMATLASFRPPAIQNEPNVSALPPDLVENPMDEGCR